MCCRLLCALVIFGIVAQSCLCFGDTSTKSSSRLDVFAKLTDGHGNASSTLSVPGLSRFSEMLMTQMTCADTTNGSNRGKQECEKFMCINTTDLASHTYGVSPDDSLTKEQFEATSVILLDLIVSVADHADLCHMTVNTSALSRNTSQENLLEHLLEAVDGQSHISETTVSRLLEKIRLLEPNSDTHDETHDDDDDEAAHLVVEPECLSYDSLRYYLGLEDGMNIPVESLPQLAALVTYLIQEGAHVEDNCRLLPTPGQFTSSIFSTYGDQTGTIDLHGMESLMTEMGIGKDDENEEGEHHDEHRRRRSLVNQLTNPSKRRRSLVNQLTNPSRRKREASVSSELKICYSAEQLMALYDSPESVDEKAFKKLCPALVSQKLFAECSSEEENHSERSTSDAELYGYSSIATFVICAASVFGILFLPCVSERVYNSLMSTLVGLAMGTLFSDAILHLIPMALGIHNDDHTQDDEHEHSSGKIVVEEYVRIGLCIMGCLYGFYLLEVFINMFGRNATHSKSGTEEFTQMDVITDKHKCHGHNHTELEDRSEKIVSKDTSKGIWNEFISLPPLAVMVVLGDAVHNFADGLAVAAAFSFNVTSGVATSIAILCHELPHELGDFAVLLQSGCSFKKAFALNLISALTAFAGLYVGIQVTTSHATQSYIFASAAAMFTYIALVDLLPEIIRTKSVYHIILNNVGILLGYGVIFVLAITEEHIKL